MNSTIIFLAMFVVFAGFLLGAGIFSKRWVKESSDFILAGREVSLIINMMGVCAIGFAGTTIALAPGFAVLLGLKGSYGWGLIYSLCGILLFGLLYAKFIRLCGAQTLPEFLEMRFGGKVRSVVSITSVVGMAGILANNIVACADTIVGYTAWNKTIVIAAIFAIIITFTFISGLWAATITDFFQVCIGVIAVPTILTLLVQKFGGFEAIKGAWPGGDFINAGIGGASLPGGALTYPSIFNFVICFAAALVWGNNYYWMKIASCRSEKVARKSFVLAAIILAVVFMIPLGIVGLYAGAFFTDEFAIAGGTLIHTAAYGMIVKIFTPILGSFFVIAAVAASISTASTSALGASAVATRDIYQRLINPKADTKTTLIASKWIMLLICLLTWGLCQFPGGPTYLFAFANCWLVPPAILLGLGAIWPRFNTRGAICGAAAGMITMVVFTVLGDILKVFVVGNYIYLASLGFIVTLVAAIIATFTDKPKYYGASNWERVPTSSNRKDVDLDKMDLQILEFLRLGHIYMSDITDALGVDSKISGASIEKLDQGGYIVREGLSGTKFYTFAITEKGRKALPVIEGKEVDMLNEGLSKMYVELLYTIKNQPEKQADFVKKYDIKSMYMASISSHLTRQGYILEKGLFKRKLAITDKGSMAVSKYYGKGK